MDKETFITLKVGDVVNHPILQRPEKVTWVEAYWNGETQRRENHSIRIESGRRMKHFDMERQDLTLVSKAKAEKD